MVRRNPLWKVYREVNTTVLMRKRATMTSSAVFFLEWVGLIRVFLINGGVKIDAFFNMSDLDGAVDDATWFGAVNEGGWHILVYANDVANSGFVLILCRGAGVGKSIDAPEDIDGSSVNFGC